MADNPPEIELSGLTGREAAERLAADGPNELPGGKRRSILSVVLDVLREPMLVLLLAAGAIYLLLGDIHDALILLAFVWFSVIISIVQESRTERAIVALRNLSMPQVQVIRDGEPRPIPSREIVRGDLVLLGEGDRIAADGWLAEAKSLQADESVLTGESVPVSKRTARAGDGPEPPFPGGEELPYAFSGTMVVRGSGTLRVAATGERSQIGLIGQSLATLETETPRLTLQTRYLVRWFAAVGLGVSLLATLLYGLLRGGWLEATLSGIAIAMSMLPEELPVVLTLFMTMGALRMSRARVLARRGSAIETLGAATVLCADKTGTLTQNRMEIAELRLPDGSAFQPGKESGALPDGFAELADIGVLACLEQPFDPMEQAFHALADRHRAPSRGHGDWTLRRQYALSSDLLAVSHVWKPHRAGECMVAAKGAPEAIAELCGLSASERAAMEKAAAAMAENGLRVLGIAQAGWQGGDLPESQRQFDFAWRGLVGLADPVRASAPDAVRQLGEAGVRVVMITGDYPVTARAIARQAGIPEGEVMTGEEVMRKSDEELAAKVRSVSVFARTMPDQKLRIVRALKDAGEIVAMTGDGVNDAPSLKAAHIGIAMGRRGTDVAREASDIVLLDDDFGSIVSAVRVGRRIYDNIRKAAGFIFAVHVPIGGLAIAPLVAGWPLILGPVHIALLEMIVDPVCTLVYEAEPEEPDVMRRPPRRPESPLVSRGMMAWSAVQGCTTLALLLLLAWWANFSDMGGSVFRATCFAGLIVAVLVLVFANRHFASASPTRNGSHNWPMIIILGLVAAIFSPVFLVPDVARLLRFAVLDGSGILAVAVMAAALSGGLFLAKRRFRADLVR